MMRNIQLLILAFLLFGAKGLAQFQDFSIKYLLNGDGTAVVEGVTDEINALDAVFGGEKLENIEYTSDGDNEVWKATVSKNPDADFIQTYIKFSFTVPEGKVYKITNIKVRQRMEGNRTLAAARLGFTLNDELPDLNNPLEVTEEQAFYPNYVYYTYTPTAAYSTVSSKDTATLFVSARSHPNLSYSWFMDDIEISGYCYDENLDYTITVSDEKKQKMRYGIDAERLWYWRTNGMSTRLAELGVKEMKSDYVRVAVLCDYEREEGVKILSKYNKVLNMMNAMKTANPDIKFFASPRPLAEAYTNAEKKEEWGHKDNVPWAPYPRWILQWVQNGTKTMDDGTVVPKWKQGTFDVSKLVQYYADYLNLMHEQGFKISYLDVTNEKNVITSAINKYLYDNIPTKLNDGVNMPSLVAPSSWSRKQGTDWLKSVNKNNNEHLAFDVASTHNTNLAGSASAFAAQAEALGKEVWNTELHGWVGIDPEDEILNSASLWEHIRGGFSGIDSWLFYGPYNGKDHTMVWSDNSKVRTSFKYEIFKQVVNTSNYGNYLTTTEPTSLDLPAVSFIKDSILTVWVLNTSDYPLPKVYINFQGWNILNRVVEVTRWGSTTANTGQLSKHIATEADLFSYPLSSKSLYFFKIDLTNDATPVESLERASLRVFPSPANERIYINLEGSQNVAVALYNLQGKLVYHSIMNNDHLSIPCSEVGGAGVYIVKVKVDDRLLVRKVVIE